MGRGGRIDHLEHDIRVADRKREKANEEKGIEGVKMMNVSPIWDKVSVTFRYSRKQTLILALSVCSGSHRLLGTWKQGNASPPSPFLHIPHTHTVSIWNILFNYSVEDT